MPPISYARHRFPPVIIQRAVWLYVRFTLSFRDVEDLLAERGLDVSHETVRRWVLKFGPAIARRLRQGRARPTGHWHLDEMAVRIASERMYLWRAVDDEGEVLDVLVQRRRDKAAARNSRRAGCRAPVDLSSTLRNRSAGPKRTIKRVGPGPSQRRVPASQPAVEKRAARSD